MGEPDRLPTVLFLCAHNAGRSRVAMGWFDHPAPGELPAGLGVGT